MSEVDLFQQALGLADPWRVTEYSFDADRRRLELRIDFARGATFACPECDAAGCAVHDTETETWRHLDFFQHQAFSDRAGATSRVRRARDAAGQRAVGQAGQRVHAAL